MITFFSTKLEKGTLVWLNLNILRLVWIKDKKTSNMENEEIIASSREHNSNNKTTKDHLNIITDIYLEDEKIGTDLNRRKEGLES